MRRAVLAVVLVAAALGLAACGGSDGDEAATTADTGAPAGTEVGPGSDGRPAIIVETPTEGSTVSSPVTVSGTADVFEANVTVVVEDADGNELARDFTTATCGTGCRGDFSLDLPFSVDEEQAGTIVVQDDDAAGTGTPPHVVEIPVTLGP